MGYCATLTDANVLIPAEHTASALAAALPHSDAGHNPGPLTLAALLRWEGFSLRTDDEGGVEIIDFDGKLREQSDLVAALAPYIIPANPDWPARLLWMGEDGEEWGDEFEDGNWYPLYVRKTWSRA